MPGGKDYRKWYAMRKAMQERGTWKGKQPTHAVPEQEEGEPPAQRPRHSTWYERTIAGADLSSSLDNQANQLQPWVHPDQAHPEDPLEGPSTLLDTPPALENTPTAEGNVILWFFRTCMGQTRL